MANEPDYELVREKITLDQRIGKESTQVFIEGDIIVPDVKPDMGVILQSDANITIDSAEASTDRVNILGKLEIQVIYLAKTSEKPIHSMSVTSPIDDFVNMEGVNKEAWVEARAFISNASYKMLNDRKLQYKIVADIVIIGECANTHDIVTDIRGIAKNQLLRTNLNLNKSVENKHDTFIVKDDLPVPSGKPNIREILQSSVSVSPKEIRVMNGKVTVSGNVNITALYKGDTDASMIEFTEYETPFSGVIEVGAAREEHTADVALYIAEKHIRIRPDADGEDRVMEAEIMVGAVVKVHCQQNMDILRDAYCIDKTLNLTKTRIKYPQQICRNKNQCPVKDIVQLEEKSPDILQVFKVSGKPFIDETRIIDDKVIVEGAIEADVLYVAQSDETPLYSFKSYVPFKQTIETKGARADMSVSVEATVEHSGFNMLGSREIELRFSLNFNTQVTKEQEAEMVTDVAFEEIDKSVLEAMPSMIIYVVQPQDCLWKIAKLYNVPVDELAGVNYIEGGADVTPGQKLLVLKKVVN